MEYLHAGEGDKTVPAEGRRKRIGVCVPGGEARERPHAACGIPDPERLRLRDGKGGGRDLHAERTSEKKRGISA